MSGKRFTLADVSKMQPRYQLAVELEMRRVVRANPYIINGKDVEELTKADVAGNRMRQHKGPQKNKLETDFENYLVRFLDVADARFGAISFELANGAKFKPDFTAWIGDHLYAWEVKGPWASRDAFVRLKVAARLYPKVRFVLASREGRGPKWNLQKVEP